MAVETVIATAGPTTAICLLPDERWWGGVVQDGACMPFGFAEYSHDLRRDLGGNQAVPFLVSNQGRYLWSEEPFYLSFDGDILCAEGGSVQLQEGFHDLRDAFKEACHRHFPASGRKPKRRALTNPQFNTWMEMGYEPTQEGVLDYAQSILNRGIAPGVLILDDGWSIDYGDWRFHPGRFPDPATMMRRLNDLGFAVMLWLVPFISPDSAITRDLGRRGLLLRDEAGEVAIRQWWNGHSAVLDATHPRAVDWLNAQLDELVRNFGVAGFKMDGGDIDAYHPGDLAFSPTTPAGHCEAWGKIARHHDLLEYRAAWKLGGGHAIQRLREKHHRWGRDGLADLIPNGLAQGLAGHAFICPDMVGGGDIGTSFGTAIDSELFVRTAQCSALFPMVQFSIAPWRVLDSEHLAICMGALETRNHLMPIILDLADHASKSGEPIMRHLAYVFPEENNEDVADQFMLGDDILVAPVIERFARTRNVVFPSGVWKSDRGESFLGPCSTAVEAPLNRLPWFRRTS